MLRLSFVLHADVMTVAVGFCAYQPCVRAMKTADAVRIAYWQGLHPGS